MVKMIISHDRCADGIASAMIAKYVYPRAEVMLVQYGPERDSLEAAPDMLFVDMTPPEDKVMDFVRANTVVMDHHKKQKRLVEQFGCNGYFADEKDEPGVSGALLAFRYLSLPGDAGSLEETRDAMNSAYDLAVLTGIRDTWQKDHPRWEEACILRETLLYFPLDMWLERAEEGKFMPEEAHLQVGEIKLKKQKKLIKKLAKEVLLYEMRDGEVVAIAPTYGSTTSDLAEYLRTERHVHTLATFWYSSNGSILTLHVSMRSDHIDVSEIASRFGGGGHTNAAGFELRHTMGDAPLEFLLEVLQIPNREVLK